MILTGTLILCPITNVETSRACNYHTHTWTHTHWSHMYTRQSATLTHM